MSRSVTGLPPIAEYLSVAELSDFWQPLTNKQLDLTNAEKAAQQLHAAASRDIELALATRSDGDAADLFASAESALQAAPRSGVKLASRLAVGSMLAYLPLFAARRSGHTPPAPVMAKNRYAIASLLATSRQTPAHKLSRGAPCKTGHEVCSPSDMQTAAESQLLALNLLLTMAGKPNYPATARENWQSSGTNNHQHHSYVLDGDQKIPLRIRNPTVPDSKRNQVLPISYKDLVKSTMDSRIGSFGNVGQSPSRYHMDWLATDAQATFDRGVRPISFKQLEFLQTLSAHTLQAIGLHQS